MKFKEGRTLYHCKIESSETNGTISLSHGQQMMNIGSSEQIVELSSGLDKFHNGSTASSFIGTDMSLNMGGRARLDAISSADNADRNESLGSNLVLPCIEDEKSALERNVPSCERTEVTKGFQDSPMSIQSQASLKEREESNTEETHNTLKFAQGANDLKFVPLQVGSSHR